MASFVTEVLANSGKLEKEDLGTKISKLSRRVEEIKGEVCDMINKKYNEFLPSMQSAEDLAMQVDHVSSDMDLLKSRIENEVRGGLFVSANKFTELKQQLEKNTVVLSVLRRLQEFDAAIESYNRALLEKDYITAAYTLKKVMEYKVKNRSTKLALLGNIGFFFWLKSWNLTKKKNNNKKKSNIRKFFKIKKPSSLESLLKTELHISCTSREEGSSSGPFLAFILQAFAVLGELHSKLRFFSKHAIPMYLDEETLCCSFHRWQFLLQLELKFKKKKLKKTPHINVSAFLLACQVIQATEKFEEMLKNLRFLKDDATDLLRYARNVNAHFASKKCQDVIVAARNFMTSEIHNTIKISPDSKITLPKLPSPESGDTLRMQKVTKSLHNEMVNLENEKQLSCYSFSVPTCRISESVQKLLDLAYQTLLEATSSSSPCAVQLFYTVRNIFQLFYDVVPTYHKENLQKFPQLAAIHHNNCMYIAHHLLTLGHQFRNSLPSPLKEGFATFVDLVPCFRRLGTDCFLAQMRAQKAELLERLSTARNFSNLDDEDNYSAANKAVRQVIHQLKRLGKVWQDVLPVNIYCKAMGTLLNTAITEIISKITALEDISTEDGDRLYSLCRTVVKEGPHVFTPLLEENKNKKYQEEVPISVQKWMKFKELMILLQASLQEIVDRWADGKGSLAAEFTSNEVKSLIRALFQNTDRRAAALTKIK
uniref:Centromere/kinetochore protein zw10 homolog n=1 Tax=Latimeria chalumnae TaxID=7897 RepID=H3BGT9_LATCH